MGRGTMVQEETTTQAPTREMPCGGRRTTLRFSQASRYSAGASRRVGGSWAGPGPATGATPADGGAQGAGGRR